MTEYVYAPTLEGTPIRQFTIPEYHRMAELGFFAGERVELLFGAIVPKVNSDAEHEQLIARQRELMMTDKVEPPTLDGLPIRLLRRSEYDRLAELGVFEGERVELLFGAVVPMAPIDQAHVDSVDWLVETLVLALNGRARVTCQAPFAVGGVSEPEPDIYVRHLRGRWLKEHPTDAQLIIEVSRSSLGRDRGYKSKLYGLTNVEEYWIVNQLDGVIEVYRDRQPDGSWKTCTVAQRGESVSPLAYPDVSIAVDDVIPPADY